MYCILQRVQRCWPFYDIESERIRRVNSNLNSVGCVGTICSLNFIWMRLKRAKTQLKNVFKRITKDRPNKTSNFLSFEIQSRNQGSRKRKTFGFVFNSHCLHKIIRSREKRVRCKISTCAILRLLIRALIIFTHPRSDSVRMKGASTNNITVFELKRNCSSPRISVLWSLASDIQIVEISSCMNPSRYNYATSQHSCAELGRILWTLISDTYISSSAIHKFPTSIRKTCAGIKNCSLQRRRHCNDYKISTTRNKKRVIEDWRGKNGTKTTLFRLNSNYRYFREMAKNSIEKTVSKRTTLSYREILQ